MFSLAQASVVTAAERNCCRLAPELQAELPTECSRTRGTPATLRHSAADIVVLAPLQLRAATACRDDPCQDIAFAIEGSCVPTRGEKPSTPGSRQFSCNCFDYYK